MFEVQSSVYNRRQVGHIQKLIVAFVFCDHFTCKFQCAFKGDLTDSMLDVISKGSSQWSCVHTLYLCSFHFIPKYFDMIGLGIGIDVSCICASQISFLSCMYTHIVHSIWLLWLISFSCPSSITTNCLCQLCTDISGWPNIYSDLYFNKPPSHLHHLDKRWDRTFCW